MEREALGEDDGGSEEGGVRSLRYSRIEVLREKDFADCTPEEIAEAIASPCATCRTPRPSGRRTGGAPPAGAGDPTSVRPSGTPCAPGERSATWNGASRVPRVRRLVLICDVSGSMEPYARALLRFAHVLVAGGTRVEAFALGTRLTRLTRQLSSRDPDRALLAASAAVADWSGGTRLGEGFREFNDRYGVTGMARGSEVVVLSDGWDRGDPAELEPRWRACTAWPTGSSG